MPILKVDEPVVSREMLLVGMNVELEHGTEFPETDVTGDDPILTAKIALRHIMEGENYYPYLLEYEKKLDKERGDMAQLLDVFLAQGHKRFVKPNPADRDVVHVVRHSAYGNSHIVDHGEEVRHCWHNKHVTQHHSSVTRGSFCNDPKNKTKYGKWYHLQQTTDEEESCSIL